MREGQRFSRLGLFGSAYARWMYWMVGKPTWQKWGSQSAPPLSHATVPVPLFRRVTHRIRFHDSQRFRRRCGQAICVQVPEFPNVVLWFQSWKGPDSGLPFIVPIKSAAPQLPASTVNARNATTTTPPVLCELPTSGHDESPAQGARLPKRVRSAPPFRWWLPEG